MVGKRRSSRLVQDTESSAPSPKRTKLDAGPNPGPVVQRNHTANSGSADETSLPKRQHSDWKVGAHVSAAGGVENTILNAVAIGANAFALFVKSQRKWTSPPLSATSIRSFRERMIEHGYTSKSVLPHGSYLINLGNPDDQKRRKSYDCFLDDLQRCEQLGLTLYNFHPGSTVGDTTTEHSIALIAECINKAHKATEAVTIVLENMAGAGNIIGGDFKHLADIIAQVEDKSRVGVCLDTCHMFAAGYDIRKKEDWDATLETFDTQVGLGYLRGMHLNDSKTAHSSRKDRHENIGIGYIGVHGFHHILNDPRVQNIPLILETPSFEMPHETWAKEIEVLNRLSGLDLDVQATPKMDEMVSGIRASVQHAEKASGKSKIKPKTQSASRKRRQGKSNGDKDENEEEED